MEVALVRSLHGPGPEQHWGRTVKTLHFLVKADFETECLNVYLAADSETNLSLARPCSKSGPTMRSMETMSCITLLR